MFFAKAKVRKRRLTMAENRPVAPTKRPLNSNEFSSDQFRWHVFQLFWLIKKVPFFVRSMSTSLLVRADLSDFKSREV